MNRDIYSQAEQLNKKHRRKRTWYEILSVPICLVVFVTTYALSLPAITMESTPDTYCGIAEHVHTDDCYELPGPPAHKEIQCTAGADLGQGEYIVHKHDSFCFDDSGELLCALAEQDEHVHTDACYDGDSLICGLVTGIVHQHTADCVCISWAIPPPKITGSYTSTRRIASYPFPPPSPRAWCVPWRSISIRKHAS